MSAAVGRIVGGDDHSERKQVLEAEIPLVDLRVTRLRCPHIVLIHIAPVSKRPVFSTLCRRQLPFRKIWKQVFEGRDLMYLIVREVNGRIAPECRPRVLEVGGRGEAIEDAGASAQYRVVGN